MPEYQPPNYTQAPNQFYDEVMPEIDTLAEMKITDAIIRQTFGWHRSTAKLSITRLMKLTGLSREATINGTEAALKRGWIQRRASGNSFEYFLTVAEDKQSNALTGNSLMDRPFASQQIRPIKESSKEKKTIAPTPRARNPLFDAIALGSFKVTDTSNLNGQGGRVGKIVTWLKSADPQCDGEKLQRFYSWYDGEFSNVAAPRDVNKFAEHYTRFMETDGKSDSSGPAVSRPWTINRNGDLEY